jgi:hypothetical protein
MKKIYFITFFKIGILGYGYSQAETLQNQQLPNNPRLIQANELKQSRLNEKNVKVSEYFGLDEQILGFLRNKQIPSGLPKSTTYSSKTDYIKAVNKWMKDNSSFILPEKQGQIITE